MRLTGRWPDVVVDVFLRFLDDGAAPTALAPLIRTIHHDLDPDLVDDNTDQETYIIEPQSGGHLRYGYPFEPPTAVFHSPCPNSWTCRPLVSLILTTVGCS